MPSLEVRLIRFGTPKDSFQLSEQERLPEPTHGQLSLEVLRAPIDPMDLLIGRGHYPLLPDLPAIAGAEGIAQVKAVGEGCQAKVGQHVLLPIRKGSWQHKLLCREEEVLFLPAATPENVSLDVEQGSMLRVNGLTAYALLHDFSDLQAGDSFIHSPASGGVGQYLAGLAIEKGLRPIHVVRDPQKIPSDSVLREGPILTDNDSLHKAVRQLVDFPRPCFAFDGTGGQTSHRLAKCLQSGGKIISYGAMSRSAMQVGVDQSVFRDISVHGFWLFRWTEQQNRERLQEIVTKLAHSNLSSPVAETFPLSQFSEAIERARDSKTRGRILLDPSK